MHCGPFSLTAACSISGYHHLSNLRTACGSLLRHANTDLCLQVPKYFGLEDADLPAIAIHEGTNDGKYFFKNAAVKKVEKWLNDFEVRSLPSCALSSVLSSSMPVIAPVLMAGPSADRCCLPCTSLKAAPMP